MNPSASRGTAPSPDLTNRTAMSEDDVIRLDLPATHKYLNVLGAGVTEMLARVEGLDDSAMVAYNVQLAIHEICVNIVNHAYDGTGHGRIGITLGWEPEARRLTVDLDDTGRSFDIATVPDPDLEQVQVHGYGLFLVREFMDTVEYRAGPGGNRWHLSKNL